MSLPRPVAWTLHSPRRLFAVGAAGVVLVSIVGSCTSGHSGRTAPPSSTSVVRVTPSTVRVTAPPLPPPPHPATTPATVGTVTVPRPAEPSNPPAGVTKTAVAFVTAWARPTLTQAQWFAGVKPWATAGLNAGLKYTLPANVPYHRVLGVIAASGDSGGGQVEIRCDTGNVAVIVTLEAGKFKVADIEPA